MGNDIASLKQEVFDQKLHISKAEKKMSVKAFKLLNEEYLSFLGNAALSNERFFEKLAGKLNLASLKVFRQLNRSCCQVSKQLWACMAWLRVKDNDIANNKSLQEFNTFFQTSLTSASARNVLPIQNFSFMFYGFPKFLQDLESFTVQYAPHIKTLDIKITSMKSKHSDEDKQFFKIVRMLMENVEFMHLCLPERELCYSEFMEVPEILSEIFSTSSGLPNLKCLVVSLRQHVNFAVLANFPNLEELIVCGGPEEFFDLYTMLCCTRDSRRKSGRKVLDLTKLDTIRARTHLNSLIEANLPLKHLALNLRSEVTNGQLAAILNHYGGNLVSLKLLKYRTHAYAPFNLLPLQVTFENLKEVELWGNVLTNLNFLKNTPCLVSLKVDYCCFEFPYFSGFCSEGPMVFQGDMVRNSSLLLKSREFTLPTLQKFVTDCKLSLTSWTVLTGWMPNLRVLEAPIPNNLVVYDVCNHLKKLEKLRLRFGSGITDDGIVSDLFTRQDPNSKAIRKLKFLRSFELEVECGQGKLTNKSAELGFLKLPHLGCLKLGFSGRLTEEMERQLGENIGHFEMYRRCSRTVPGEKVEKCCQWIAFQRLWRFD